MILVVKLTDISHSVRNYYGCLHNILSVLGEIEHLMQSSRIVPPEFAAVVPSVVLVKPRLFVYKMLA